MLQTPLVVQRKLVKIPVSRCMYCKMITDVILKCVVRFTCQVLGILEREEPSEVSHHLTEDICKILYEPI